MVRTIPPPSSAELPAPDAHYHFAPQEHRTARYGILREFDVNYGADYLDNFPVAILNPLRNNLFKPRRPRDDLGEFLSNAGLTSFVVYQCSSLIRLPPLSVAAFIATIRRPARWPGFQPRPDKPEIRHTTQQGIQQRLRIGFVQVIPGLCFRSSSSDAGNGSSWLMVGPETWC